MFQSEFLALKMKKRCRQTYSDIERKIIFL